MSAGLADGPRMKLAEYFEFLGDGDPLDPIEAWLDAGNRSLKIGSPGAVHLRYAATRLKKFKYSYLVARNIAVMEDPMHGILPSVASAHYQWKISEQLITSLPPNIFWEDGYNELGTFEDPAVRAGFIAYELEFGKLVNAAGHHRCYLNISAETAPLLLQYLDEFLPIFEQAYLNNDLIGLHGYWSPHFYYTDEETSKPVMEPLAEPFLFPHRMIVREMKRRGIKHIPMFFYTEGPSIDTNLQYNRFYDGFLNVMDRATMAEEIRWAEGQVHDDPYFAGGASYIWERAEQLDKIMYNDSTRQPRRGEDNPEMPSVFEHRLAMSREFGPGAYQEAYSGPVVEPPPEPEPEPAPAFPAWYRVDTSTPQNPASKDRLRLRRGPGGEIVGLIAPGPPDRPAQYLIEKIVDGWAYVKGTEQVLSAQFLVKA